MLAVLLAAGAALADGRRLMSPDGAVAVELGVTSSNRLTYAVWFRGRQVVAPSAIGLMLDGEDLGRVASLTAVNVREVRERFPVRGAHAEGRYDALVALFTAKPVSGPSYGVQFSVANEGFAWRFLVPGADVRRVTAETACWRLPPASLVWCAESLSGAGAEAWRSAPLSALRQASRQGPVRALPLIAELPEGRGYAAVTEAALYRYSGLRLEVGSDLALRGVFSEEDGFRVEGRFRTPWRVVLLAVTLEGLVNSDLLSALNPPPDPELFGSGEWTAGGRSVRLGLADGGAGLTLEEGKRLVDDAARLKFEFAATEEGWEARTNAWPALNELCAYGRTRGVRVLVWKKAGEVDRPDATYAALRTFLDRVKAAGAAGVTIGAESGEHAGRITFEEWVLQEAAARKLLVHFSGGRKPTGESRTYPNEVTRAALRGWGGGRRQVSAATDAALPFTRGVAGPAECEPLAFSERGATTWPHQLAMAYLVASPLLVMAEQPRRLLDEPQLEPVLPLLEELPVAWDETRVLEGSRIGELAALARRKGSVWYVAVVNGTSAFKLVSFAPVFTGWGRVRMTQVADVSGKAAALAATTRSVEGDESVIVTLEPHGGFVAKLVRE